MATIKTIYITNTIAEMIENAYQENSPEFIYFIVLFNIFSEFLDDISEDNMPNEMTGFKNTKLWNIKITRDPY